MASYHHSISIHFARAVCRALQQKGLDEANSLARARINPELLELPRSRISPHQLSSLIRAAIRATDDELMALAGERMKIGLFSLLAHQVVKAKNLREVYQQSTQFYNLVTDSISLRLEEEGEVTRFVVQFNRPDLDPDFLLKEFFLLIWHRFPSWLLGERIPLLQVNLQHPRPAHVDEYRFLFPCPCYCDQAENSLVIPTAWLDKLIIESEQHLNRYLRRAPIDWFIKPAFYLNVTRQVYEKLDQTPEGQLPNLNTVAKQLHMSVRTLRRKLQGEGSSFQRLKDNVRRDKAVNLLADQAISVAEVARQVGFTEPAAFIRAFKHWTGLAPGGYRKGLLARRAEV